LIKETAALAAGAPPELNNANLVYWYTQGEMADLTSLVGKFKDKAGGLLPIATASLTAPDGKTYGAPYAIDCWPAHWRKDVIEPVTGGGFFKTWEDLISMGPKIQKPPQTYAFAMALGHEGDHANNMVTVLWDYGGRINDDAGKPDIANPANKKGIEIIVEMWKAKLIPPETFAQTVTSWNNETYQKGRGMVAINPATIYGWLLVNDKELAAKTGLAPTPKGSAGSFAEGAAIGFGMYKKAKLAEKSPSALEFFMQPDKIQTISKSVEGRFVPIYIDHTKTDFWNGSAFAAMKEIAQSGRVRNWPAPPQPWESDIEASTYVLSDMFQKIVNDNMAVDSAQSWAQESMMTSYNKFAKK
jgi:ABC-type glycerol-3-phosphate transport system substrate-binding protein